MKKEDLEIGNKLQSRIREISNEIDKLKGSQYEIEDKGKEGTVSYNDVMVYGNRSVLRVKVTKVYTDKANTNLEYLNQCYRDNVLRTLEDCKKELVKEFELLGSEEEIEFEPLEETK